MATAIWFRRPGEVGLGAVTLEPPAAGELLVATTVSGISAGTELLAYRGELDEAQEADEQLTGLQGTFTYPFRYGYSCVGRVEESRSDAVEPGALVFAFHPHQDRFVVPAHDAIVLDAGQDERQATLLPLVETALQLSLDAGPVGHEPVVVLGLGVVGLLSALLLVRHGAEVVAADPVAWRRTLAGELGLTAIDPRQLGEHVASRTGGTGVPLVLEASGNPGALAGALDLLAHEGTALVASWYGTKPVTLPLGGSFHRRRLTIRSSQVSTIPAAASGRWTVARRRAAARDLLGRLPLAALATHQWPVARAAEAYRALSERRDGVLHAALTYPTAS